MKGQPTGFWGKLERAASGDVLEWHPLATHCADVAAVTEALLELTLLRRRLAVLGGRDDLDSTDIARLSALAAFHDIGKFNVGFQRKADVDPRSRSARARLPRVSGGPPAMAIAAQHWTEASPRERGSTPQKGRLPTSDPGFPA